MRAVVDRSSPDHAIFFGARLPRVLMGAMVGAVLAAVGAALQALVRNPLAEGGILGISGGGALRRDRRAGGVLASRRLRHCRPNVRLCRRRCSRRSRFIVSRWLTAASNRSRCCWSALSSMRSGAPRSCWSTASSTSYFAHSILFWLMGSLEAPTYREVAMVTVLGGIGFAVLMSRARDLNLLSLGDEKPRPKWASRSTPAPHSFFSRPR